MRYQEILMSSVLNLQARIGKCGIDRDREEHVGTIWGGFRLAKYLAEQGLTWDRQGK